MNAVTRFMAMLLGVALMLAVALARAEADVATTVETHVATTEADVATTETMAATRAQSAANPVAINETVSTDGTKADAKTEAKTEASTSSLTSPEAATDTAAVSAPNEPLRLKAEAPRSGSTSMGAASVQMMLGLAAVLALIFALAWLAKRMNLNVGGNPGTMRVVSAMNVGTKEKILLLEVENSQFLVGVTTQQITLLHVLGGAEGAAKSGEFASRMQTLLKTGAVHE